MANIVLKGSSSGAITVAAPATAGTNTLTLPARTGTVAFDGPAFSAHLSANQNIATSTFTKIAFNTELFDTNNNYSTSTYRFTPTLAGYYQINGIAFLSATKNAQLVTLYKNGVEFARGNQQNTTTASSRGMSISYLVSANGSSDYFELYAFHTTGITEELLGNNRLSCFQAYLARAA